MDPAIRRFLDARSPCGPLARELAIGDRALRFVGLSDEQAAGLERFWGPYLAPSSGHPVHREVSVCGGGRGVWLAEPVPGELYRVEPRSTPAGIVALSYAFACGPDEEGSWRVALADDVHEPASQSLENVARLLVARSAVELGGFAMHSAGVVKHGKAWIFAGPSGSGKSTAVSLSSPAESLGDDFGVVLPDGRGGWVAPPLPFDNAPAIVDRPALPNYPVAGIWRLFKGSSAGVERPAGIAAVTSLSTCTAFPSAMPDLAGKILDQVGLFCQQGFFGHLTFGLDRGFWGPLRESVDALD